MGLKIGYQFNVPICVSKSIPDEGVHLDGINIVELLDGSLDVVLVGTNIADKDKSVVVLDLAHGRLGVQGRLDDGELVQGGVTVDGLAGVLGGTGELQGLGKVETGRGVDLAGSSGVGATEDGLAGRLSLLNF